jgi:hypothetical protein
MSDDTLTVVWAKEAYWPTRSHGFEIGPLTITTTIHKDETPLDAYKRCWADLEAMANKMYLSKREAFHQRARNSGQ